MLRYLILAALAVFLWRRLVGARLAPEPPTATTSPGSPAIEPMEQDPVCLAYIARSSALTTLRDGRTHYFCSAPCYRRFLSETTAAAQG